MPPAKRIATRQSYNPAEYEKYKTDFDSMFA